MPTEKPTVDKYKDDLTANLLETCTGSGLLTVEVMFKIGAVIELGRLGYRYEKVNLGN